MILSKIKKHFSLLSVQIQQKNTIKNILLENSTSLNIIINSLNQLSSNNYQSIFDKCEAYREILLQDNKTVISFDVFGMNKQMLVKDVCRKATSKKIWAQFIFLITKNIQAPYFLEIGTNLGVSGSYILEALKKKKQSKFITMEGVSKLCEIAGDQFKKISDLEKYQIYEGLYDITFPKLLKKADKFNIIFIDGNHEKVATLRYFNSLKLKLLHPGIIILDDINWNSDMQIAWQIIKNDSIVSYSIDFFKLGIIIINDNNKKASQHYKLHLSY